MRKLLAYIIVYILAMFMIIGLALLIFGEGLEQRIFGVVLALVAWWPGYVLSKKVWGNKIIK